MVQQSPIDSGVIRAPATPKVQANSLVKPPGLPPLRLRGKKRDQIDAASLYRWISPDFLETFAPEHLACARYMFRALEALVMNRILFPIWSPGHSQAWILGKLTHEERKVILL